MTAHPLLQALTRAKVARDVLSRGSAESWLEALWLRDLDEALTEVEAEFLRMQPAKRAA
jgi:hypothetical protein